MKKTKYTDCEHCRTRKFKGRLTLSRLHPAKVLSSQKSITTLLETWVRRRTKFCSRPRMASPRSPWTGSYPVDNDAFLHLPSTGPRPWTRGRKPWWRRCSKTWGRRPQTAPPRWGKDIFFSSSDNRVIEQKVSISCWPADFDKLLVTG